MDTASKTRRKTKPTLSFWEIWNMSFGFLGIQFGFALQNANTSRIFEMLGAEVESIPILWVAAPATGLIVQPIIGYFSDRTWHPRLGRRRPYFLFGAILASIALIIMPNSPALWVAAGMLWIMDASINVSMEPFRAFVGDNLPSHQRTKGFAMQSFFIGTGAVIASALPWVMTNWFGIANTAPEGVVPPSVKWSFYIGAAIFLTAVLWTVFRSKEYSPEEQAEFDDHIDEEYHREEKTPEEYAAIGRRQVTKGLLIGLVGAALVLFFAYQGLAKELYLFAALIILAGLLAIVAGVLQINKQYKLGFVTMVNDFQYMPKTMRQLIPVQFFSWFALFSMWIYTTAGITSHIYGTTDTTSEIYNEGADMVGLWFAIYNLVAALVAFLIPVLAKQTSRKVAHLICLALGGIGLISIYFLPSGEWGILSMIGVGIAWASILSIPYAMLTGSLPAAKMGYYMGIFNFFIVIPQLVAASILGFLVAQFFNNEPIYSLVLGGVSMIVAGLLSLRVEDDTDVRIEEVGKV
jgi:maltose/moltooligosaccharide transporter